MNNLRIKYTFIVLVIIAISFFLRWTDLVNIPPGLNRDEAAIGYTAYSILLTGRDEHGSLLPISLKSFGDWKLPGYMYAAIPFVAVFDLNVTSVRLPSVLFGIGTVLITYFICQNLFNTDKDKLQSAKKIGILAAFLLALAPWHIFFSRVASEANMAVFIITLGFYILLLSRRKLNLFPMACFVISLSLLIYHGNHIYTPLIFIVLVIWYVRTHILYNNKREVYVQVLAGVGIFVIVAVFVYWKTLFTADITKISGLLSINDPSLVHEKIVLNRLIYKHDLISRVFNNKLVFFIENVAHNYLRSFSPEFLFIKGGGNEQHNIPDFGNLYLIEAPFILLGLYFLFKRREDSRWVLLWWLLISPLGAALTKDAPHSARQFAVFPAITLVIAYGINHTLKSLDNKPVVMNFFIASLAFMYLGVTALFLSRYYITFPYKSYVAWGDGITRTMSQVANLKDDYKEVVVSHQNRSPYIYYLFYQKSDPAYVQQTMLRYPKTEEGFEHVRFFDGVQYKKINWTDELLLPNRLYVDWAESVPTGATNSAVLITKTQLAQLKVAQIEPEVTPGDYVTSRIVDIIFSSSKEPLFYLIETQIGTPAAERL